MTVAQKKGPAGTADVLFSRIVRHRGQCEYVEPTTGLRCTQYGTDTAHIIGRRYSATRCLEDNAWCMCRTHHMTVDEWPHEKMWMVERTIGVPRYKELYALAQAGIGTWNAKLWWLAEVDRLKGRCLELGLDTRRRIPA